MNNNPFRTYLSFFPLCLGLYQIIVPNYDFSTPKNISMLVIGWSLTIVYGYCFIKWSISKVRSLTKNKAN